MTAYEWRKTVDMVTAAARLRRSGDEAEAITAAIWWSIFAEPGDGVAGVLCSLLSEAEVLDAFWDSTSPDEFLRALGDASAHDEHLAGRAGVAAAWQRWAPRRRPELFAQAIRTAESMNMRVLRPHDDEWPPGLDDLGIHRPRCLWVRGDPSTFLRTGATGGRRALVAVVGARASTSYGEFCASELAGGVAGRGGVIVSGGAYGIDGAAHRSALAMEGATIAVMAGGADRLYPTGNERLLRAIIATGAVVSEVPPGTIPSKWRFLQRNRLIAAIADVCVVVEAGARSGALNTAHHCIELDRPLGAVPGPITSSTSIGCHRLLRDGFARCVTTVEEVLDLCHAGVADSGMETIDAATGAPPDSVSMRVRDALSFRYARTADQIAGLSGVTAEELRRALGKLEALGEAARSGEGWLLRSPRREASRGTLWA